jgi:magnesium chelatase family protein
MISKLFSLNLHGLDAQIIEIEIDIHKGLPSFSIVGLGDTAIQEARERVRTAIKNSNFQFPRQKIVVNLAPAHIKKHGPRFDLAIALGILNSMGMIQNTTLLKDALFIGELAFSGEVRGIRGILPSIDSARKQGFKRIFIPAQNAEEASLIDEIEIIPVKTLLQLLDHLNGTQSIEPVAYKEPETNQDEYFEDFDLKHIKGQEHAKRALEISAAGGHNVIMSGPPGSGKTMLAKSLVSILPQLTSSEALDITRIHSVAGVLKKSETLKIIRPFRCVHHTASGVAIVGGGNPPRPGEISLAHRGVLFLDEIAEFPQKTLEVLRQPLEDGVIRISRSSGHCQFPARFTLVAAMNPCPCGFYGDNEKACTCSAFQIQRYRGKISGPILDRIDIHIQVPRITYEKLSTLDEGETSQSIRQRVQSARSIQKERFKNNTKTLCNADMSSPMVRKHCTMADDATDLLKSAVQQMNLSGRAYYRLLKLARTIADLSGSETIQITHIAEAIGYREKQT